MPSVSIIVPVYNVEAYLRRCLDSILAQTYTDYELILVDDGSPDACGTICDEYAERDSRIRVIHKENGGLASARNAGLSAASGKYILFCDSDDSVHTRWCEYLVKTMEEEPDAFIVCGIRRPTAECPPETDDLAPIVPERLSYFQLYKRGVSAYACNKIFSADKLRAVGLSFNESEWVAEDVAFTAAYCALCEYCLMLPERLYYYWQREDSIMHQYNNDAFALCLRLFKARLPLIRGDELEEYCDIWFYHFSHVFDNVFDVRNTYMSFLDKLRYNQRMIKTEEFRFCLDHGSLRKENPLLVKMLRYKNYYAYWAIEKAAQIKNRTGGVFK